MINYNSILKFWFREQNRNLWFLQNIDFDHKVRSKFFKYYSSLKHEKLDFNSQVSEQHLLSKILLLNIFPKKIFRNTHLSFAYDSLSRSFTQYMICSSIDIRFTHEKRIFIYLPLANSENLSDLKCALCLYQKIQGSLIVEKILNQINLNQNLVYEYSRLPQRNIILGRKSSTAEKFFLTNVYQNLIKETNLDLF